MSNAKEYALENIEDFSGSFCLDPNQAADFQNVKSMDEHIIEKIKAAPEEITETLKSEYLGNGPISELINDHDVTEIIIDSQSIHFEREGKMQQHHEFFMSQISFNRFTSRVLDESNVKVDWSTPTADGKWLDFRLHVVSEPISQNGLLITLRRQSKAKWTLADLLRMEMLDSRQHSFLKKAVEEHKNILVVGPTGSGKTTLLNSMLRDLDESERLVVLEDTDEIELPTKNCAKLLTRIDPNSQLQDYELSDLLRQALRMRPDRIALGEVRSCEAKDLLLTLSTGHSGFVGTLHAGSAKEAIWRLEMLVQMGAPQWSKDTIRQLIYHSLNYVIVVKRDLGKRKITETAKVAGLEANGILLEPAIWDSL